MSFFLLQLNLAFLSKQIRAKQLTFGFRDILLPQSEAGQAELGAELTGSGCLLSVRAAPVAWDFDHCRGSQRLRWIEEMKAASSWA